MIKKDEVILYGAGFAGEKFYCLYRSKLKIKYVIDRVNNRKFHNIYIYGLKDKESQLKGEYIIVAVEEKHIYEEIATELRQRGLVEYVNFIWSKEYNKKLVVMYGNCHFMVLEKYLNNNPYFARQYATKLFYVGSEDFPDDNTLQFCDILLTQDIREDNSKGVPSAESIIHKMSDRVKVLRIPNLYGCNLFFPQAEEIDNKMIDKHINERALLSVQRKASVLWMTGWRDKNIERIYDQGGNVQDIKKMILEDDVYEKKWIINNFWYMIDKYKEREKHCDIKIIDYILKNYKERCMFTDPKHPSQEVIMEIGRRIIENLNIIIDESKPLDVSIDEGEMFIYGCVKNALELKYEKKIIRNIMHHSTLFDRGIDIDEYIIQYLAWHYSEND